MRPLVTCVSFCICVFFSAVGYCAEDTTDAPGGWTTHSPREEIRPSFSYDPNGGPEGKGTLVISADERPGLFGWWQRTFDVEGGKHFEFSALYKAENIDLPRRAVVSRILWQDEKGNSVSRDKISNASYNPGTKPRAEPDFPVDQQTSGNGWTRVSTVYHVPAAATKAVVELSYRWAPAARVEWAQVKLVPTAAPIPRKVRLATVHYIPHDGTAAAEKCEQFRPMIEEAAEKKVDLLVLPETITYCSSGLTFAEVAEPIPGPSTEYFGGLAKKHDMHIAVGLVERDKHLVYNVAVLIGPDGRVIGKYRKVTLPRGEIEAGITPGDDYPVFETRFGKVGMMVCYGRVLS